MPSLKELTEKLNAVDHKIRATLDGIEASRGSGAVPTAEEQEALDRMDAESASYEKLITIEKNRQRRAALLDESDDAFVVPSEVSANDGPIKLAAGRHSLELEPGSKLYKAAQEGYSREYRSYLRTGRPSAGLMVSDDSRGGYLAPTRTIAGLIQQLDDVSVMRLISNVLPPLGPNVSLGAVSWDADPADADWTPEVPATAISEDNNARLGKRQLTPHALSKLVKISTSLLQSSAIDIEAHLRTRFAYKFSLPENKAFLTGSGNSQPLGIFTESDHGLPSSQNVATSSATGFTADDLIDAFFTLKGGYASRSTWLCHRSFIKKARQLKGGDGQYLWQPGLGDAPATILGRPYVMDDNAPSTFTANQPIAVLGDFDFYWIVDALDLQITVLDQPYRTQRQIGYLGEKSTDGMPVLAEAFVRVMTKA